MEEEERATLFQTGGVQVSKENMNLFCIPCHAWVCC
jgi:hypothetical protein